MNAECFNFCNNRFVNTQMFFLGTTECSGLVGSTPYVAGCTLQSSRETIDTASNLVSTTASGQSQFQGSVQQPFFRPTNVFAGSASSTSSATAAASSSGQFVTDESGIKYWVPNEETSAATSSQAVVQGQPAVGAVNTLPGVEPSLASGQQQQQQVVSGVQQIYNGAGQQLLNGQQFGVAQQQATNGAIIGTPQVYISAQSLIPQVASAQQQGAVNIVGSTAGPPPLAGGRGQILSATVTGSLGTRSSGIQTASGAPQVNVAQNTGGSSRIFGNNEGSGGGKGKGKGGKGKKGKKRSRTYGTSNLEALPLDSSTETSTGIAASLMSLALVFV